MKWLEIIELRSVNSNRELLESTMQKLIVEVEKEAKRQELRAYSRVMMNTDFSIHLYHDSKKEEINGSQLGLCLASSLKEFGLINHSVWVEMRNK